ncbi:hypothetical protein M2347_002865 [Chryseobacterium sp. H1D6B]|uniref:hypothetical protein n=1 Tax=Chryseobacterium sp. H1D6B TaxID=2940588 RepID=UPI0015C7DF15|nr:hypothetical protein [Chryseobacterium sp. H1D6B]MDH6253138.1 hypothetical protein [Chryseobacterium sp. H1D6B]
MKKITQLLFIAALSSAKAQSHTIECTNIAKIQNPKEYYDEYNSEGGYGNLTIKKKTLKNSFFGSKDKSIESIKIKIQTESDGSSIMSDSKKYVPEENEIALFLEDDDRKAFVGTKQQIFFKTGEKIKKSITSKKLDGLRVLTVIKCGMLDLKKMPIDDILVEALEKGIN